MEDKMGEIFIFGVLCVVVLAVFMSIACDILEKVKPRPQKTAPPMLPTMQSPQMTTHSAPMYPYVQQPQVDPNVQAILYYLLQERRR